MRRQIPIVGGFYKDSDRHWSRQDCLNWIPVKAERPGALTDWQLRDAPGLKPAVQVHSGTGGIRGARNVEGKLFLVTGQTLYRISNAGVAITIGTIPGVGRVSMAHNAKGLGNELLTVNGSAGYVYDTSTQDFAKVTDSGYPGAFVADFVDQYLAQVEPQGRYWFHSDLANAHAYNTLDQYQAEGDPDRIVSLLVSHREVLVFGADTIEPYVNTGGTTGTFQRASNTVIEVGCAARFTPRRLDSSAFWLDDQRLVRRLDGYTPAILSTEAIAGAFAECTEAEISQAFAFTWEGGGHKVYYITVPGRFTFGYDAKTGEWHRRASYGLAHWAVSEIVFWNGKWYACDSRYPRLYELDSSYKLDGADPLIRERTAQVLWADQNEITLDELELLFGLPSEPTEAVAFPEQPEGPEITGDAPNGTSGDIYNFAYTLTPGSAPIVSVQIIAGSLPPGLSLSSAGVITGTPTEYGSSSFTVIATDANGLQDRLQDTILIGDAMAMALYPHIVLWAEMDEVEDDVAIEEVAANHGEYRGVVEWEKPDPFGTELGKRFGSDADAGVFFPNTVPLQLSSGMTVITWIARLGDAYIDEYMFSRVPSGGVLGLQIYPLEDTGPVYKTMATNTGAPGEITLEAIGALDGDWHMVTASFAGDETGDSYLYVDTALSDTELGSAAPLHGPDELYAFYGYEFQPKGFGRAKASAACKKCIVLNKALDVSEVQWLYNAGSGRSYAEIRTMAGLG